MIGRGSLTSLWAKQSSLDESVASFHPLVCHMLDVMQVCRRMWEGCLAKSLRAWISVELGLGEQGAIRSIAFWAAMHDIGKASPSFQRKWPAAGPRLESVGLSLRGVWPPVPHGTVSAIVLPKLFEPFGLSSTLARQVATALGGHHGVFPSAYEVETGRSALLGKGDGRKYDRRSSNT